MNRRGQMELLGLAVVVVLITFGLLLSLRFFLGNDDDSGRQEVLHSELAANFLSVFFKTTADCKGKLTFTELYQDVARSQPTGTIICGDGRTSQEYVEDETYALLESVIWNRYHKDYRFAAKVDNSVVFEQLPHEECRTWKTKIYGIPLGQRKTVLIQLDICD